MDRSAVVDTMLTTQTQVLQPLMFPAGAVGGAAAARPAVQCNMHYRNAVVAAHAAVPAGAPARLASAAGKWHR
jgi:hypothetical protein